MSTDKKSDVKKDANADLGVAQLQGTFDKANEQGFFGVESDPTPNENYTLAGVTKGLPTPETDAKQAAKVKEK